MILTLIRHGITAGNAQRFYYGAADIPLLPEGEAALKELAAKGAYPTAARYHTSPLIRTEQTFSILYGDTPHTPIEGLREMDFGDFEMRYMAGDLENDPVFQAWRQDATGAVLCPNGESMLQVQSRALEALAPVIAAGEDTVCVIHGVVITLLMWHWFPDGQPKPFDRIPAPGTGFQIEFDAVRPVSFTPIPYGGQIEPRW